MCLTSYMSLFLLLRFLQRLLTIKGKKCMTQHCVYCRIQIQKFPQAIIKKLQLRLQSHNLNRVTVRHHEADPANSVWQTVENKYLLCHCTLTALWASPDPAPVVIMWLPNMVLQSGVSLSGTGWSGSVVSAVSPDAILHSAGSACVRFFFTPRHVSAVCVSPSLLLQISARRAVQDAERCPERQLTVPVELQDCCFSNSVVCETSWVKHQNTARSAE